LEKTRNVLKEKLTASTTASKSDYGRLVEKPVGLEPLLILVARGGIEPPTQGFSVPCSTD
jgi:hypothetical protein